MATSEDHYRRLNDELERKTNSLLEEADKVMRHALSSPRQTSKSGLPQSQIYTNLTATMFEDLDVSPTTGKLSLPPHSRVASAVDNNESKNVPSSHVQKSKRASKIPRGPSGKAAINMKDRIADRLVTDSLVIDLKDALNNIERQMDLQDDDPDGEAAALAQAAEMPYKTSARSEAIIEGVGDLSLDAQLRFMKAKVRVLQEEADRFAEDCRIKDEEIAKLQKNSKDFLDEKVKLQKNLATSQSQSEKFKQLLEQQKTKCDQLETQLSAANKELEQFKRKEKQQATAQTSTDARLNRAQEEVEKYKALWQKAKTEAKESVTQDKRTLDQLAAENKKLERQKNELLAAFRKQMKLIDILRRQKLHIEAARLLQFTEDEFLKLLDWPE